MSLKLKVLAIYHYLIFGGRSLMLTYFSCVCIYSRPVCTVCFPVYMCVHMWRTQAEVTHLS